jgi:arylsulfatase A
VRGVAVCGGHAAILSRGQTAGLRPNILLINCDDLGYGDLGCYGSTLNETPHLDQLAQEGVRFTDFLMASPLCSPSRAALLTGCYPPRIGFGYLDGLGVLFPGHRLGLNPDEVTLAKVLADEGYATMHVGKWHCGDQPPFLPTRHGFDGYYGIPYSNDMGRQVQPADVPTVAEMLSTIGLKLPVDDMPPLPLMAGDDVLEQQPEQSSLTARFVEQSLVFMRANRDRPFFLYLAHIYVHLPIYVQERFAAESRNGTYGAAVATIDWATGVLLAELKQLGLDENTIVIFTSDNGSRAREGGSNGPLRGRKGTTWEGGLRVPCIVRWPGRIPVGVTCDELAASIDLFPTLAGLAGANVAPERTIDGVDIASLLFDPRSESPRSTFWYYRGDDLEAVREGRWKLHLAKHGNERLELYDLAADAGERDDLLSSEPEVAARLVGEADAARRELGDRRLGVVGSGVRAAGEVENPATLTSYDPHHPYYMAEYDLPDRG